MLHIRTYWDAINWAEERWRNQGEDVEFSLAIEMIAFIYFESEFDVREDIKRRRDMWEESRMKRLK